METIAMNTNELWTIFFTALADFLKNLNWAYIITVVVVCYFLVHDGVIEKLKPSKLKTWLLGISTAWRVVTVGVLIGFLYGWLGTDEISKPYILNLINSLISAMVFHGLLLKGLQRKLDEYFGR